ncbi:hypothetical protein Aperf_G00000100904 [Anoplocephala perfoliata]
MEDYSIDLSCVEMFDKDCSKILDKSQSVHLYVYNKDKAEWEKSDIGGVLYICERSSHPHYTLYIVNRQNSSKNFTQPLISSVELLLRPPHIFFRNSKNVFSLWFFAANDTSRIYDLLKRLISNVTFKERAFISSNKLPMDEPIKVLTPLPKLAPKTSNIKDLLSFANDEYVQRSSNEDDPPEPIAPAFDPAASLKFKLQNIALDALPLSSGFSECQFVSDLEKSFKASSALKVDNNASEIPVRSIKEDNDKINDELLRRLRRETNSLPVPESINSSNMSRSATVEGLSRNQLKAALIHLIENDEDFLTSLHVAYSESLNKRLH